MKNLVTTIFILLISISFSIHSQDRVFQCEGMETQDYVINGEESWWGEWAGTNFVHLCLKTPYFGKMYESTKL